MYVTEWFFYLVALSETSVLKGAMDIQILHRSEFHSASVGRQKHGSFMEDLYRFSEQYAVIIMYILFFSMQFIKLVG